MPTLLRSRYLKWDFFCDFQTPCDMEDKSATQNQMHIIFFRHFADATEFMDDAIQKEGKVFINCVFGKSRSTTFVVVYLMLCHNWDALTALKHIRQKRPVQINAGFLLQLVDLDYKLKWEKLIKWSFLRIKLCMYFGQHN